MPKRKTSFLPLPPDEIIKDYRLAYRSRQVSVIGRREVLSGKAKFGIFGDGKEVVQLAIARAFQKGDWRSGYYRDQTWVMALGVLEIGAFFAQLYAHADLNYEPATAGRSMVGHFVSRFINPDGTWADQTGMYNIAADVSPTAAQMPRAVGLAYASRLYREIESLSDQTRFSRNGEEVTWATIGNASTSEGLFWESVNAIGVLKAPAVISIFDDGYGISVPNQFQMVKENIGAILKGFERDASLPAEQADRGYDLYSVRAWDYPALIETYQTAGEVARTYHIPALVHVTEMTQPLGHSTSGSHERYKSTERLQWEGEFDGLRKMREWMIASDIANENEIADWEAEDALTVENIRKSAWESFGKPLLAEREEVLGLLEKAAAASVHADQVRGVKGRLAAIPAPTRRDMHMHVHETLRLLRGEASPSKDALSEWKKADDARNETRYGSLLVSEDRSSALKVPVVPPSYSEKSPTLMGFEVINLAFDSMLAREPRLVAFGEDVGKLGDVNQGFKGMQEKFGALRVSDTTDSEWTPGWTPG